MSIISFVFQLVGSLVIFLFGMQILSTGLQNIAGKRLRSTLNLMTKNRFIGVFIGFVLTVAVQSSSASTVVVISLVNANLLKLLQAISVIMGANVGTTATAWLISKLGFSVSITAMALPIVAIAFPFYFLKRFKNQNLGEVLIGFGLLFIGLGMLKDTVPSIDESPAIQSFIAGFSTVGFWSLILFALAGIVITWVVQSSSASMTMIMTMAFAGWISLPAAAALVLGSNVGTTITAILATIGANKDAKRTALMHFLFNLIGLVWALIFFRPLLQLVELMAPGEILNPVTITLRLAIFHSSFNIINMLLFLPFIRQVERLLLLMLPGVDLPDDRYNYRIPNILVAQKQPEADLINLRLEIWHMLSFVESMFQRFKTLLLNDELNIDRELEQAIKDEDYTDQMQEELTHYIVNYSSTANIPLNSTELTILIRIINEIESIGDSCLSLVRQVKSYKRTADDFDEDSIESILAYDDTVRQFLSILNKHLNNKNLSFEILREDLEEAKEFELALHRTRMTLNKYARKRLESGSDVKNQIILMDMVSQLQYIGDYILNILEAMRGN